MIILESGLAKGKVQFTCPTEAWDFKMDKLLDGAKVKMHEKTRTNLGFKMLCEPRIIIVTWSF